MPGSANSRSHQSSVRLRARGLSEVRVSVCRCVSRWVLRCVGADLRPVQSALVSSASSGLTRQPGAAPSRPAADGVAQMSWLRCSPSAEVWLPLDASYLRAASDRSSPVAARRMPAEDATRSGDIYREMYTVPADLGKSAD